MIRETSGQDQGANILDIGAVVIWIASLVNILPSLAALLSVMWLALRIMESRTVQGMLGRYSWLKKEKHNDGDQD